MDEDKEEGKDEQVVVVVAVRTRPWAVIFFSSKPLELRMGTRQEESA